MASNVMDGAPCDSGARMSAPLFGAASVQQRACTATYAPRRVAVPDLHHNEWLAAGEGPLEDSEPLASLVRFPTAVDGTAPHRVQTSHDRDSGFIADLQQLSVSNRDGATAQQPPAASPRS
jgi:hypothetical protein